MLSCTASNQLCNSTRVSFSFFSSFISINDIMFSLSILSFPYFCSRKYYASQEQSEPPPKRRFFRALCRIRLSPYSKYEQSRLRQKSSKIATFLLPASLAARFWVKTRRANGIVHPYAEQSISLKTHRKTEVWIILGWHTKNLVFVQLFLCFKLKIVEVFSYTSTFILEPKKPVTLDGTSRDM